MRIWLDDLRPMPADFDVHLKTPNEAIAALHGGSVEYISFDHDLGGDMTGYEVAEWIERAAFEGKLSRLEWTIHSANPVGAGNIRRAMMNAERFWEAEDGC